VFRLAGIFPFCETSVGTFALQLAVVMEWRAIHDVPALHILGGLFFRLEWLDRRRLLRELPVSPFLLLLLVLLPFLADRFLKML